MGYQQHQWERTSPTPLRGRFNSYDTYSCEVCGITGRLYGGTNYILKDSKYNTPEFEACNLNNPNNPKNQTKGENEMATKSTTPAKLDQEGHKWEYSSTKPTTQNGRVWMTAKCSDCGITGKVYSGKSHVTKDIQYTRAGFETCKAAKTTLAARASKQEKPIAKPIPVQKGKPVAPGKGKQAPAPAKSNPKVAPSKIVRKQEKAPTQSSRYSFRNEASDAQKKAVAKRTVDTEPKGYILLKQVFLEANKQGVPGSRVMKAIGGNRGAGEPLNENWEFVYYKKSRWLPKSCLRDLPKLAKMGRTPSGHKAPVKKMRLPSTKPHQKPLPPKKVAEKDLPGAKAVLKKVKPKHTLNTTRTTKKEPEDMVMDLGGSKVGQIRKMTKKEKAAPKLKRHIGEGGIPVLDIVDEQ